MSPRELAVWLGVSVEDVYRWNYFGTAPARHHIGRLVRYRVSDVDAWLAERRSPARP